MTKIQIFSSHYLIITLVFVAAMKSVVFAMQTPRWVPALCTVVRRERGHWSHHKHRRAFLLEFEKKHGITGAAGWKAISCKDVERQGGAGLMTRHGGSLLRALQDAFPERNLQAHDCRRMVPQQHWSNWENRRAFMDRLKAKMGVVKAEDWKRVRKRHVVEEGGMSMLTKYSGSVAAALADLYPEEKLLPHECRAMMPQGFWKEKQNRVAFLERIATKHGISQPHEWKKITWSVIVEEGGSRLLRVFPNVLDLLRDAFPEHETEWKRLYAVRPSVPEVYWEDEMHVKEFMETAAIELGLSSTSDWLRVSRAQIERLGGQGLLRNRSLRDVLQLAYPKEDWSDTLLTSSSKRATQRQMLSSLRGIFSDLGGAKASC